MKRFIFNLEKVLNLREYRERETEIELGRAVSSLTLIENQMKAAAVEKSRAASLQFSPANSALVMRSYEFYLRRLEAEEDRLEKEAALAEIQVEEARDAYLDASRERKVLDKLKEKREKEYRKEALREETGVLDDIAGSLLGL